MKLLLGIVATAAAFYFLKTEKGKALAETLKKDACKLGEDLFLKGEDLLKKGTALAGDASDRTKSAF